MGDGAFSLVGLCAGISWGRLVLGLASAPPAIVKIVVWLGCILIWHEGGSGYVGSGVCVGC
jgi:hypothetical protein